MFMFRLQKIMDEYAGGITAQFVTNESLLNRAMELLAFLKEDSAKLAAANLHELMRCWENVHRMWQAEAHVRTIRSVKKHGGPDIISAPICRRSTTRTGWYLPTSGSIPRLRPGKP